jgi:purine catabolism regulator
VALTLRAALDHPVVRDARPQLLAGGRDLDVDVRWVHSSEIYEIGPLLTGGELLLTTGLGVATVDAGARRHYVRDLAQRGLAALAVETGRSLPAVPAEMTDEAERRGLPLVELREVVPFIRIAEALNTLVLGDATLALRFGERVTTAVEAAQTEERGLSGVLAAVSELLGGPLVLVSDSGALVAAAGTGDDRQAWRVLEAGAVRADVVVRGRTWGFVAAGPGDAQPGDVEVALRRLAPALALEVLRTHRAVTRADQLAERLLADLTAAAPPASTDVLVRAGAAGFHAGPDHVVLGIAVDAPESRTGTSVLESAARSTGSSLRGRVGAEVLALFAVPDVGDTVAVVADALGEAWRRAGRPPVRITVGDPVRRTTDWHWTVSRARRALALGTTAPGNLPATAPVSTARSRVIDLLLGVPGTELQALADGTLGPLRRWDTRHGSDLVRTVEVHLRLGSSPGRTAAELRIGRQATYQRLRRAEELLGHGLDDPDVHAALLVSAAAARLLTPHDAV